MNLVVAVVVAVGGGGGEARERRSLREQRLQRAHWVHQLGHVGHELLQVGARIRVRAPAPPHTTMAREGQTSLRADSPGVG